MMTDQRVNTSVPLTPSFPEQFYQDPMGVDRYVVQEKVLLEWNALHSFFYTPSRQTIGFFASTALILGFIFLVIQEFLLVGVVATGAFLLILLSQQPPIPQRVIVTTLGMKREDQYFFWQQVTQFWIENIQGQQFLFLRQVYPVFRYLKINVTGQDLTTLQKVIGTYLLYKKPQQNFLEKAFEQFMHRLPINFNW
jgi:hypothetical protein